MMIFNKRGAALVDVMVASSLFIASFLGATKLFYSTLHGWRTMDHFVVLTLHGQKVGATDYESHTASLSSIDSIIISSTSKSSVESANTVYLQHEINTSPINAMLNIAPMTTKSYSSQAYDACWEDVVMLSPSEVQNEISTTY
ncbi:hypothetical protein [Alteromonas sp. KUL49]|uniref:hypothetical protein n=1 Tax=Alteromonas sp. KUL49 TaxID=2480798 RepID=UPI00102EED89|nr:hypothetical protein [Alteromonas sp. KUL49]TAP39851.1 hypothetical protein EYS00_11130 [Alteromonas sp. KUL49]GEA11861.1 hypothetical protein KUL49_22360 [Alteromonas sp. KUL49]